MRDLSFKERAKLRAQWLWLLIVEPVSGRYRYTVRAIRRGIQQQLELGVEFEPEDEDRDA